MDNQLRDRSAMRFLTFSDDNEDAEKLAKLKEAASTIEKAIAKEKSLNELVDYVPIEEPEIELANDTRPLYERLLDQRKKKEEAFEESQKLSNLVSKLDEDDATYLNEIVKNKQEEELKKRLEVFDALEEKRLFKEKMVSEEEIKMKTVLLNSKIPARSQTSSLKDRLSSLIKIKSKPANSLAGGSDLNTKTASGRQTKESTTSLSKRTHNDRSKDQQTDCGSDDNREKKRKTTNDKVKKENNEKEDDEEPNSRTSLECNCNHPNVMKCIGVLPSLPIIDKNFDSDDSDQSEPDDTMRTFIKTSRGHK